MNDKEKEQEGMSHDVECYLRMCQSKKLKIQVKYGKYNKNDVGYYVSLGNRSSARKMYIEN